MYVQIGAYYRHYKTRSLYRVTDVGLHTETNETTVAYKSIEDGKTYFRPLEVFTAKVEHEGAVVQRFTPQAGKLTPDYIHCLLEDARDGARELGKRLERICSSVEPWQR